MRHRRLEAFYPVQTINGLIAHLSQFAPRISSDAFASRLCLPFLPGGTAFGKLFDG